MIERDALVESAQSGRTLVERELVASLGWLIGIRWIAGLGVLTATWATGSLFGLRLATGPLYAIGVSILVYNILFYWMLTRLRRESSGSMWGANLLANLQIAADWVAMTLLIHLSGGVESPVILYFFPHCACLDPAFDALHVPVHQPGHAPGGRDGFVRVRGHSAACAGSRFPARAVVSESGLCGRRVVLFRQRDAGGRLPFDRHDQPPAQARGRSCRAGPEPPSRLWPLADAV